MNRPDRFWKSIDVLAEAYLQGTLIGGSCGACAVGNLIANEVGASPTTHPTNWPDHTNSQYSHWYRALDLWSRRHEDRVTEVATVLPYTNREVYRIETAFEENTPFGIKCEDPPIGTLMAVVDVLFDIHDVEDEDLRAQAQVAFEGEYEPVAHHE